MRRTGIVMTVVGLVFLVGALIWSTVAVPQLVRFPLDTNQQLQYSGNLVTYVNQRSGATLAKPASVPLTVDRHMQAQPNESSSGVAIVKEQLVPHYSGTSAAETNVYAIDRRQMNNVSSDKAYTFAPGNPGAVSGSYYVTLPMNLDANTTGLRIWKPETGTTYPLKPAHSGNLPSKLDGLSVIWFNGTLPMTPVASYESKALAARGLPTTIAPSVVEAELSARGISVGALTTALTPVLSAAETKEVAAVLTTPIPLKYYAFGSGLVGAEPTTGAIIDLRNVVDGIAVAPNTSGLEVLVNVLSHHPGVPGVPAALTALHRLAAAAPQPVYGLHYTETPASVTSMVQTANSQLSQISIVTVDVPWTAVGLGGLLLIGGVVLWLRGRTPPGREESATGEEPGGTERSAA